MNTEHATTGSSDRPPHADPAPVEQYEIRVDGRLGRRWGAWFDGLTVVDLDDGTTTLRGPVVDQAALHGVLQKLRDLGVPLLSLTRTAPGEPIAAALRTGATERTHTTGPNTNPTDPTTTTTGAGS